MSLRRRREPVAFGFRIVLYLLYGLPLLWIVLTSLKSQREVLTSQASLFFTPTFDAYAAALADPALGTSLSQSVIISVGTTVVCLAFEIPAAYALARNGVFTVSAIIFLVSWGEFLYGITFMLTPSHYPMSALIAVQSGAYGVDWPAMMAFAVVSAVPVLVVYVASLRLLSSGLTMGAVK